MKLIIGGSLFFSILQSILLWNRQPGISAVLFIVPFVLYFIFILNKNKKIINKKGLIWLAPIICLSLTYFIFDNSLFDHLNAVAICLLWLVMCVDVTKTDMKLKELIIDIFGLIGGAFEHIETVCHNISDLFKQNTDEGKAKKTKTIIKAVIITVPVVFVVIILLSSADSIFSNLFSGLGNVLDVLIGDESLPETIAKIIVIAMFFMYIAGFIYNIIEEKIESTNCEISKTAKIDTLTVQMMLTILNVIYVIFCIIQIVYLFIQTGIPNGMTYSEYARQGFFQLIIVTIINFAILFWIGIREKDQLNKFKKNYIKLMEAIMEVCTQVIIISAFYRMFLYEQAYGYTYLRLFVYFILIAEFIFMIFVLVDTIYKKINSVKIGLIVGTVVYVALNYINVDAVIAKNNIDRYFANQQNEFDFYYLKSNTGYGAIPEIQRLLESGDEKLIEYTKNYLKVEKLLLTREETWFEFNLSRQKARENLKDISF